MSKKTPMGHKNEDQHPGRGNTPDDENNAVDFRVDDRRHWASESADGAGESGVEAGEPARPTVLDEYRQRAENAESKLLEYIEAYKNFKQEQDQFRERMNRDVERRVNLKFGEMVGELLESVDDLDLAMAHVADVPEARSLLEGLTLARNRFVGTLERHGVESLDPQDGEFDPNQEEAVRVDPVDSKERDGTVTETLRPGYRLGEFIIRPARVAVGRYSP